jgi:glycosyltransferase involved in cell wall biosynthesis
LYEAIKAVVACGDRSYEIILVDDGSTDETFAVAQSVAMADASLKIIKFRGNFGQTPAMAAGIDRASGEVIVTMDGDLQNDPADIPLFLEKIDQGYDIAVGWRHQRRDKLISRKVPSVLANWLIGRITGVPIKDNGCSLKAYRSSVIKHVPLYSEMHRFIPAMASMAGARIVEIKVRHHPRRHGQSKYGLSRIYKVLLDLLSVKTLISFAARPLYWFSVLAAPFLAASVACIAASIYQTGVGMPFSVAIAGSGVLFGASGLFLMAGGILAELIYGVADPLVSRMYRYTAAYEGVRRENLARLQRGDRDE